MYAVPSVSARTSLLIRDTSIRKPGHELSNSMIGIAVRRDAGTCHASSQQSKIPTPQINRLAKRRAKTCAGNEAFLSER